MFQYVVETDTGKKREINEDRVAVLKRPEGLLLVLVADGMGGHNAGDVASEMTVSSLSAHFLEEKAEAFSSIESKKEWLSHHVQTINKEVYDYARKHPACKGMGTTLIAALVDNTDCVMCHIGDSRAYVIDETVAQLTRDHSYVNVLVDNGEISEEEAEDHPKKNWIVKALGTEPGIEGEFLHFTLTPPLYLLICSDGLSNKITKNDIATIVCSSMPLSKKGEELVKLANHLGGEDNISFVLLSSQVEEV
ncbi:Stp1/IreP family PP2C-type Ser/Thr phosphatase [Planomicrobium sp. CPCC 101079]|uniref:Stp1/IreP family PP2C-type Ser/Thr phosphatase n=1 Tax=Planomicrobium sp. CPCC 101079 TaxID=2599618 RepID=UPI0011B3CDA9|nr:Stp1/IreP family PP2C-type Ser/Thr phosphatase [Planomicrobium sp. CPCC 101079]TWT04671.1 Stp1/IreP family PP2C-type Ser/Thr phosphatase [Planomicrobium sp. CPCC 101079]